MEVLEELEKSIKELVDKYETASAENQELKTGLTMKELEIKSLRKKLDKLSSERNLVRDRVDALISRVEGLVSGT
ncbi:MAG: cell division protein ZapB [Thermodesulfobacteriota bacterium]